MLSVVIHFPIKPNRSLCCVDFFTTIVLTAIGWFD